MRTLHPSWQHKPTPIDRRSAPRHEAQLEARLLFSISAHDAEIGDNNRQHSLKLVGYTRNISETGLALVLPSLRGGDQYFNVVGCTLRLTLQLPTGKVQISATPVRCEWLDEKGTGKGYLIGVQITKMSDEEWVRLVQYVRSLR